MKYRYIFFSLLTITQCTPAGKTAGSNSNASTIQLINSKNYMFVAQYAQPVGGRQIPLTSEYALQIKNDSLISYLPFFGQAYVAPLNPEDAGITFTSVNFNYTVSSTKKGSYNIVIKPKEESKANQMILNVTSSGYANLQVLSANRQAINFRGIVRAAGR